MTAVAQPPKKRAAKPAAAKAKPAAKKPPAYPESVRAATRRANDLRRASGGYRVGPKQVKTVLDLLEAETDVRPITADEVVRVSGVGSLAALRRIAGGEADRAAARPLRALGAKTGDQFCTGRWLAAELAAIAESLKGGEKP